MYEIHSKTSSINIEDTTWPYIEIWNLLPLVFLLLLSFGPLNLLRTLSVCLANKKSALCIRNSTYEWVFQRPQNSTSPKDECYLWPLKNPWARVFFKFHEKSCYYLLIKCMKKLVQCIYNVRVCSGPSTLRNFGVFKNAFVLSLILEKVNL